MRTLCACVERSQARDNTINSQVTALRERVVADGLALEPDRSYVDEGYSGSLLTRPALERLRDAVAAGQIGRIYIHAPDRLARRYAHQVLVIDEFRRAGAEMSARCLFIDAGICFQRFASRPMSLVLRIATAMQAISSVG